MAGSLKRSRERGGHHSWAACRQCTTTRHQARGRNSFSCQDLYFAQQYSASKAQQLGTWRASSQLSESTTEGELLCAQLFLRTHRLQANVSSTRPNHSTMGERRGRRRSGRSSISCPRRSALGPRGPSSSQPFYCETAADTWQAAP